jgi:hypothetical protein
LVETANAAPERTLQVGTLTDMLINEQQPVMLGQIVELLVDKLLQALEQRDLDCALGILRTLNKEHGRRTHQPDALERLHAGLGRVAERDTLRTLMTVAESVDAGSSEFLKVQDFLFLMDRRLVVTLLELVATGEVPLERRKLVAIADFLWRNRVELLAEGLESEDPLAVRVAVWVLGRFGSAALPQLRRARHHPDPRVRLEAVRALGGLAEAAGAASLRGLVGDRDPLVARASVRALATLGAEHALPAVEQELADPARLAARDEHVVRALLEAAGQVGGAALLPALRKLTERTTFKRLMGTTPVVQGAREAIAAIEQRLAADSPNRRG